MLITQWNAAGPSSFTPLGIVIGQCIVITAIAAAVGTGTAFRKGPDLLFRRRTFLWSATVAAFVALVWIALAGVQVTSPAGQVPTMRGEVLLAFVGAALYGLAVYLVAPRPVTVPDQYAMAPSAD
jgi:hypothetical protein